MGQCDSISDIRQRSLDAIVSKPVGDCDNGCYLFKQGHTVREIDTILCTPSEWKDRVERFDSDWLARTTTTGQILALRVLG